MKGRSLTGLENDNPHMHPELFQHLWVHFQNNIHFWLPAMKGFIPLACRKAQTFTASITTGY